MKLAITISLILCMIGVRAQVAEAFNPTMIKDGDNSEAFSDVELLYKVDNGETIFFLRYDDLTNIRARDFDTIQFKGVAAKMEFKKTLEKATHHMPEYTTKARLGDKELTLTVGEVLKARFLRVDTPDGYFNILTQNIRKLFQ